MNTHICLTRKNLSENEYRRIRSTALQLQPQIIKEITNNYFWPIGSQITIGFLNGTEHQQYYVKTIVQNNIQPHVNLVLRFLEHPTTKLKNQNAVLKIENIDQARQAKLNLLQQQASQSKNTQNLLPMIRVQFEQDQGSWSALGREALDNQDPVIPTINFGWLNYTIVVHEFLHALGFIHEHKRADIDIVWNITLLRQWYRGIPHFWTFEQIDRNIVNTFNIDEFNGLQYDPKSIMRNIIPCELIVLPAFCDDTIVQDLSEHDIKMLHTQYPSLKPNATLLYSVPLMTQDNNTQETLLENQKNKRGMYQGLPVIEKVFEFETAKLDAVYWSLAIVVFVLATTLVVVWHSKKQTTVQM